MDKREYVGAFAYREGNLKYKRCSEDSYKIHQYSVDRGLNIPKIIGYDLKTCEKAVEWIEGIDLQTLCNSNQITSQDWEKCGEFVAKMNNLGITSEDMYYKNFIRTPEGEVILIDLDRLYLDNFFPEELMLRYFTLSSSPYFKEHVIPNFIEGYKKFRRYDIDDFINKMVHVDHDNYQDLYCNDILLKEGSRSNKRLKFLPKDMKNLNVLDLGCSMAMFARESKKRGADKVWAVDNYGKLPYHRLIELPHLVSIKEGLDIVFQYNDIENQGFKSRVEKNHWDITFFCAILGHLKGDRLEYVKWIKNNTDILYYETNLGNNEEQAYEFLKQVDFSKIERLGESGDPERNPKSSYKMFRCER